MLRRAACATAVTLARRMSSSAQAQAQAQTQTSSHALSPFSAVIYDLDGTLLDTEPLSTAAINAVLSQVVPDSPGVDAKLKARIVGMNDHDWSRVVIKELSLGGLVSPEALVNGWMRHLEMLFPTVHALRGANEAVIKAHRAGFCQSVATSSGRKAVSLKRKSHEPMFSHFKCIVTGDDDAVKCGKPAPDIFLVAAKRIDTRPEHCLVFEDSPFGVTAAKDAGMQVVAIPDASMDVSRFAHADLIIKSFDEFDWDALQKP